MEKWITTSWAELGLSLLSLLIVYTAIILLTRVVGLRSFSKMSATDFAMTVAVGSLLAGAATAAEPPIVMALTVFAGLFFLQWLTAWLRKVSSTFALAVDNTPLLLMDGGQILDDNLRRANLTREDLLAKLRAANVLNFSQVRAVVFETTGDISVLHTASDAQLDPALLDSVTGKP